MIDEKTQKTILDTLHPYEPVNVGIFGSYARNEATPDSDLDILASFNKKINLLDLIGLEMTLSEKIGHKVQLVTERSLNPHIKPYIEKDLIKILGEG